MELTAQAYDLEHGTFHALSGGDPEGEPLVYLHGFPDHPPTAVAFLDELGRHGRRVLAPWLRGYAPSPTRGPYDLDSVLGDVVELIDRWAGRPVDLVGHDWGAVLTYLAGVSAADRVRSAVTLAVPHPLGFLRRLRSPRQLRRSWYMGLFQLPGAGRLVAARDLALLDRLWESWSPGFELDPDRRADLRACLDASMPAPIGYYRALLRPRAVGVVRRLASPISTPLLYLHGARDNCVLPPAGDDRRRFSGPYEAEVVSDVGHFLHLEAPAAIASRVAAWTGERP